MSEQTFAQICSLLKPYEFICLKHAFVHTSKDAAHVRGNLLEEAAKAIILKNEHGFLQVVLAGHKKINFSQLKKFLHCKKMCMATHEEAYALTDCTVGSIPPFGTLWSISVYADSSILENETIVFSAGTHYDSIRMKSSDYILAVHPIVVSVSDNI